jgi:alkylated DNA nucleotide flippase Atl1
MGKKIDWIEKFKTKHEKVVILDKKFGELNPGEKMLISSPKSIYDFIKSIPKGRFISVKELRKEIAHLSKAKNTCHLTTGIFLRVAIEYSIETKNYLPFWRVVDTNSNLAKKLSCGIEYIRNKQKEEKLVLS